MSTDDNGWQRFRGWTIWAVATLFPIYQLAIQIGYGSLEKGITQDLSLSLVQSSLLSGSFLLTYAVMQVPAGLLLDRFSPRLLLGCSALLCGAAAAGFSRADSFFGALLFRAALGCFASFGFPGAGLLARRWITGGMFVLAMGLIDFFFGLGAVGGEAGFAMMHSVGVTWRQIMDMLAIAGLVIGLLCFTWIRDRPRGTPDRSERVHIGDAVSVLCRNKRVLLALTYYGGMIGAAFGFGGLWDIRLQGAFGFNETEAVDLNSWIFVGLAIAAPLSGILADHLTSRKPLLMVGSIGALCGVAGLIFIPLVIPYWALVANLLLTGLFLGTSVAIFGVACDAVPARYAGTTIALVNGGGCLVGAALQIIPGLLIGPGDCHPLEAYQQVLTIYVAVLLASTVAAAVSDF
ncbi:MAG: MFS transporter [Planctomycetota bacterium]|nr:MFS transporter [Planctomycetota bacterium]